MPVAQRRGHRHLLHRKLLGEHDHHQSLPLLRLLGDRHGPARLRIRWRMHRCHGRGEHKVRGVLRGVVRCVHAAALAAAAAADAVAVVAAADAAVAAPGSKAAGAASGAARPAANASASAVATPPGCDRRRAPQGRLDAV